MTWKQGSFRKINFDTPTATTKRVGPGAYNISKSPKTPKRYPNSSLSLRDCLPRPDLVTPGPGAYNVEQDFRKNKSKSSFFKSRSTREIYRVTNNGPSPAEYSTQPEWTAQQNRYAQVHHPRRKKYQPHFQENANYLDEHGRLVRRNAPKRTAADIGPGTYETATESRPQTTLINTRKRDDDVFSVKKRETLSPEKYTVREVSYKIPVKIKGENKGEERKVEINQSIGLMTKTKIPKKPSPIFANHLERESYNDVNDVPGPGAYLAISEEKNIPDDAEVGVGFLSRSVRFGDSYTDTPGPGEYTPKTTSSLSQGPASVLKNRELMKDPFPVNDIVGPGQYTLPEPKIKPQLSPAFQSRDARMPSSDNGVPGPSDYDVDFPVERPSSIMHTRYAVKDDWVNYQMSVAPSPEEYTIDRELHGKKYSIRALEKPLKKTLKTPGPGAYETESTFLKQSYNAAVPKLP